jgi:hypothetical protein
MAMRTLLRCFGVLSSRSSPIARSRRRYRPAVELLEDRRLMSTNVVMTLSGEYGISSYAGVGFQGNQVASLSVSVNGEADPHKGDFQAQIQWGDGGSWTS